MSPTVGSTDGGTEVTIEGTDFASATAVTFGGTAAKSFTVVSDTTISAVAPAGAAGATGDVVVSNPTGASATQPGDLFLWDQNLLTGLMLSASVVTAGTPVTGTTTLMYAAPAGGIAIPLRWTSTPLDSTAVLVPQRVVVPGGSTTGTFQNHDVLCFLPTGSNRRRRPWRGGSGSQFHASTRDRWFDRRRSARTCSADESPSYASFTDARLPARRRRGPVGSLHRKPERNSSCSYVPDNCGELPAWAVVKALAKREHALFATVPIPKPIVTVVRSEPPGSVSTDEVRVTAMAPPP